MHYYKRNIGDYAKKAGRLTMLQHGAYTLLIDSCYDREKFPTLEDAIEWTWASSDDEINAVKFVLNKFFILVDNFYIQHRIQEEIDNYHCNAETNKRIAIERETKRMENNTKRVQSVNETPPNHEPLTNNHKPLSLSDDKTLMGNAFALHQDDIDYCKTRRPDLNFDFEFERFINYYRDKPMKNWSSVWRNWVLKTKADKIMKPEEISRVPSIEKTKQEIQKRDKPVVKIKREPLAGLIKVGYDLG